MHELKKRKLCIMTHFSLPFVLCLNNVNSRVWIDRYLHESSSRRCFLHCYVMPLATQDESLIRLIDKKARSGQVSLVLLLRNCFSFEGLFFLFPTSYSEVSEIKCHLYRVSLNGWPIWQPPSSHWLLMYNILIASVVGACLGGPFDWTKLLFTVVLQILFVYL